MSKKEWTEKSDNEKNVVIYIGGAFVVSTIERPCYWNIKGDKTERVDLDTNKLGGAARSIYVVGDTVYTCGYDIDVGASRACYWINKKRYYLEANDPASISSAIQIKVINGVVFTAGVDENSNEAVFWINQNKSKLELGPDPSQAESIFIQQDSSSKITVYIGGRYDDDPVYWKNGKINYLEKDSTNDFVVRSIYVIGNTVYSCGQETFNQYPLFWKNNKLTYLSSVGTNRDANSIFVSNEDIYISGIDGNPGPPVGDVNPCYWKNGKINYLPASSLDSFAYSIFVYNNNVYISGFDNVGVENYLAWYCINSNKIVYAPSLNAAAMSIFVKSR